jgi:hypothetical protein
MATETPETKGGERKRKRLNSTQEKGYRGINDEQQGENTQQEKKKQGQGKSSKKLEATKGLVRSRSRRGIRRDHHSTMKLEGKGHSIGHW